MQIASGDGTVVSQRLVLSARLDRAGFLERIEPAGGRVANTNGPWQTYEVRLEDDRIASVVFESDALKEVRLVMELVEDQRSAWSADVERRRKARHDQWLQATLGSPPYRFPWGSVESVFDERDMCSQVVIRYDQH